MGLNKDQHTFIAYTRKHFERLGDKYGIEAPWREVKIFHYGAYPNCAVYVEGDKEQPTIIPIFHLFKAPYNIKDNDITPSLLKAFFAEDQPIEVKKMAVKSIGQLAFEVFHDSLGVPCDWETLPTPNQIAWNETATVVRYAHHLIDRPITVETVIKIPCEHDYQRISSDPMDGSVRCTKCHDEMLGGRVVEETVDGGGIKVTGAGTG